MPNNYFFSHTTPYITNNTTVKEERAPTDASIKLMMEMEEKATKNIVDRIIVDNNLLKGAIIICDDYLANAKKIYIKFKLNGEDYESIETVKLNITITKEEAITIMLEKMSEAILEQLLKKMEGLYE